jgi:hypothetical protein
MKDLFNSLPLLKPTILLLTKKCFVKADCTVGRQDCAGTGQGSLFGLCQLSVVLVVLVLVPYTIPGVPVGDYQYGTTNCYLELVS